MEYECMMCHQIYKKIEEQPGQVSHGICEKPDCISAYYLFIGLPEPEKFKSDLEKLAESEKE